MQLWYNADMDTIRETITTSREAALFPDAYFGGLRWAVLDIETLGLSPGRAPAILCGIVIPDRTAEGAGRPQIAPQTAEVVQFFAESVRTTEDEETMLSALEDVLADVDIVVTYNGRQFDLPYLEKRRERTGLAPMRPRYDLDLLPVVRYCTDIGKFVPNLRQKTLEDFCGLWDGRTDEISGRESISLYYDYLNSRDDELKAKILLHNRDDIVQLYRLTDVLRRADMHKAAFRYGFPVRSSDAAGTNPPPASLHAAPGRDLLLLVQKLELKNGFLTAAGIQSGPDQINDVRFGDERPSWRFLDGAFSLQIPVIAHGNLQLADMEGAEAAIDPALLTSGYVVLSQGKETQYEHCCLLVQAILRQVLQNSIG